MPSRVIFLLIVAAVTFHVSALETSVVLVGYYGFANLDHWLARRARRKMVDEIIDDEVSGWEVDPDDATQEIKDNFSRVKLPQKEQIVVTRIGLLLRRVFVVETEVLWP